MFYSKTLTKATYGNFINTIEKNLMNIENSKANDIATLFMNLLINLHLLTWVFITHGKSQIDI